MTEPATTDLEFPLGTEVRVLTRAPGGLIAFDKPAGVLSHPNMNSEQPRALLTCDYSIEGEFFRWVDSAGKARTFWLLNRLDSHTSGVILGVLDDTELARRIRALFREKHIRKVYHALVFGKPSHPTAVWKDRLAIEKRGGQVRTKAGEVGSLTSTTWTPGSARGGRVRHGFAGIREQDVGAANHQ